MFRFLGEKKTKVIVGVSLVVLIGILLFILNLSRPISKPALIRTDYPVVEFSGILTGFDDGCLSDRECKAIVGDATIVTVPGNALPLPPVGKTDVNSDFIGKPVRVRAFQVDASTYTIVGDTSLFVLLATVR